MAKKSKEPTEQQWARLTQEARAARAKAYAPYSKFRVGAALLTESGKIVSGCNVENASYGLAICAERGAICASVAKGEKKFRALVIASEGQVGPCGACRQVLAEFAPTMPVRMVGPRGNDFNVSTIDALLPGRFDKSDLK